MTAPTITTLDDLLDTLTSCPACLAGADPLDDDAPTHTCGDLDWTALPTFGGEEPSDTSGVWSWDATRLLVGSCASDLRIEDRPSIVCACGACHATTTTPRADEWRDSDDGCLYCPDCVDYTVDADGDVVCPTHGEDCEQARANAR